MDVSALREACLQDPFHPFQVVTADGSRLRVPYPEFIWIEPDERFAFISDGGINWVDIASITKLDFREIPAGNPKRRRKS